MSEGAKRLWEKLSGFRYVLLVAAVGLVLLLWPSGGGEAEEGGASAEESRIASLLTDIEGVGEAEVLLSESGAVIVCGGASDAAVRLRVMQAVRCYTGLGADRVRIFPLEG